MTIVKSPKKLIEVALPLDAINVACAREKMPGIGAHPRGIHLWWARRPLAAARAVIFSQMVNDPSWKWEMENPGAIPPGNLKASWAASRKRLFKIIEDLVLWENTTNEPVLEKARAEIRRSWREVCELNADHPQASELFDPETLPGLHDPFAGGGAIPLEAQRLGLTAYASDLNPVAVLINKAMIEIPPKFAGRVPVGPLPPGEGKQTSMANKDWSGAKGLAEDVRRYGHWMRTEAEKRIGHLYPQIEVTADMASERENLRPLVGKKLTVIAWLWARTVKSPNPAFSHVDVPLVSNFVLSNKAGKEAYVEPIIEGGSYRFTVQVGTPTNEAKEGTKAPGRGANFRCLVSQTPISGDFIKAEGKAGRLGARLMAVVAEGQRGRIYLPPTEEMEEVAIQAMPEWRPSGDVPSRLTGGTCVPYGLKEWGDLFTPRQLLALTTFSDLVTEARDRIRQDAIAAGFNSSPQRGEAGRGASWYPTPVPEPLLTAARDLRKNMTDAEQLLWQCLRGKQLDGFKFRKQHPLERFVLDFYCPSAKLAVELDGGQHNTEEGKAKDAERTAYLEQRGIKVLRFWNHEVLENLDGVLTRIWDALHGEFPHPGPPPLGEGANLPLDQGGSGPIAYADAVAVYLGFAVDRCSDFSNSVTRWVPGNQKVMNLFGKQAIPMTWDYPEANILADTVGGFGPITEYIASCINKLSPNAAGFSSQADAQTQTSSILKVVSTDPPYYDNIGYADLSDFFYVWLRRALKPVYPSLFATLAVPKAEELVATPYRHGGKEQAETFFLDGMTHAIHNLAEQAHPSFPVTIYYAFKAAETKGDGTASTGWETFLEAVLHAGFAIVGTWPLRSEQEFRMVGMGTNALASSIVLVCRQRRADAPTISRRQFQRELNAILPEALDEMTRGAEGDHSPVAPVDLSQAIIGPGMAVFSKYAAVLEADGTPMSVKTALQLINRFLAEDDFDADTQFCLHWFEQHGWSEGVFGEADVLARSKATSVSGLNEAGVLFSGGGKVRLRKWADYPTDWDPTTDSRLPVWEALHQLIRALKQGGESASGALLGTLAGKTEAIRQLAYRLYTLCERLGLAEDARAYNELITSWTGIEATAQAISQPGPSQGKLF